MNLDDIVEIVGPHGWVVSPSLAYRQKRFTVARSPRVTSDSETVKGLLILAGATVLTPSVSLDCGWFWVLSDSH